MVAALLALGACDKPRPRVVPVDPMAAGPGQVEAPPPPTEGLSAGLPRRVETRFVARWPPMVHRSVISGDAVVDPRRQLEVCRGVLVGSDH